MLLSFLKFPFPVLRHRIFFRVLVRFSFVYARQLVEEGVRQNPAFVQNGENVAKTGQIGDIVPPFARPFCNFLEIRLGYYFFPTDSKEELPARPVCKGNESRKGLPRAGDATKIKAPRESPQAVCMPAGIGRGTGDAPGLGIAQAWIKCQDKMPGKMPGKSQGKC